MARMPVVSGHEAVKALQRLGFTALRTKGSHVFLARDDPFVGVTVPLHRDLDRGTLRAIIRSAGLTIEQFTEALRR